MDILGEEPEPEPEGAGTKHGSSEATPTKPRVAKRRKTAVKAVSEDDVEENSDYEISVGSTKTTPTKPRGPRKRKTVVKAIPEDEAEGAIDNEVSADATETTADNEIDGQLHEADTVGGKECD